MKLERKFGKPVLWAVILVGVYLFFFDIVLSVIFKQTEVAVFFYFYGVLGDEFMKYYACSSIVYFVVLSGLTVWSRQKRYYFILLLIFLLAFLNVVFHIMIGDVLGDHFLQ